MATIEQSIAQGIKFLETHDIVELDRVTKIGVYLTDDFNQHILELLETNENYLDDTIRVNDHQQIATFSTRAIHSYLQEKGSTVKINLDAVYALTAVIRLIFIKACEEKAQIVKLREIKWN